MKADRRELELKPEKNFGCRPGTRPQRVPERAHLDRIPLRTFQELLHGSGTHILCDKYDSWRSFFVIIDPVLVYL